VTGTHALQAVAQEHPGPADTHLELFGVPLKGATRGQLREALKRHGMRAIVEDDRMWADVYDPTGVQKYASIFYAGYVSATGRFAIAQYEFPATKGTFDNVITGEAVVAMVSAEFGAPSSVNRHFGAEGGMRALWNFEGGMAIEVSSGWPDTTTYLTFIDTKVDPIVKTKSTRI
jgi:hypothetical protein